MVIYLVLICEYLCIRFPMFTRVCLCVGAARGWYQDPSHLSTLLFNTSISHWSWLELTSWLGGLDSKLPGSSCLCLPNAAVLEKPLHSDHSSILPCPFPFWELCVCVRCSLIMLPILTAPSLPPSSPSLPPNFSCMVFVLLLLPQVHYFYV